MLLGSFVEEYDKDEGDELTPYDSPNSTQYFSERALSPESSHGDYSPTRDNASQGVQRSATGFSHSRDGSGFFSSVNR